MKQSLDVFFALLIVLMLHGCSGDGGSASTPQPTQAPPTQSPPIDPNLTVPVQTALANVVQHGFNQPFTISGSVDNSTPSNPAPPTPITGNGQFVLGPGNPSTLCTFPVLTAVQTITGTTIANGTSTPFSSTGTVHYRTDNTIVATSPPGELFLYNPYAYPEMIKAGETGQIGTGTQFNTNCTTMFFASTITGSYFATTDRADSLLVTFVSVRNDLGGGSTQTSTGYRINTRGDVSLVSITAVESFLGSAFKTLTFSF
jgi:hypothetical protein